MPDDRESVETFECFGGAVTVIVAGSGPSGSPEAATGMVRRRLLEWHKQFSRFERESELSKLNSDTREVVEASPAMIRLVEAIRVAAQESGGLVDGTLLGEIEAAGYAGDFDAGRSVALERALGLAGERAPARPRSPGRWREIATDPLAGTVTRPAGVRIDSGGIAKGLFGDLLVADLDGHWAFVLDLAGDLRLGGRGRLDRPVRVASPFDASILHEFALHDGAITTSGIGRRSWLDARGRPAHHLLDPASGRPAFTGLVQVSAIAPSGVEAEWRAKAALLSGPRAAREWLPHGGVVVHDDGQFDVLETPWR